jgi:hypothetical protein
LFEPQQFFRQTDGMRLVVSSGAIFDFDFQRHNHACFPRSRVGEWSPSGQGHRPSAECGVRGADEECGIDDYLNGLLPLIIGKTFFAGLCRATRLPDRNSK